MSNKPKTATMTRREFLQRSALTLGAGALLGPAVLTGRRARAAGTLEKEDLKFGFIKLTDMAPLAIAYEKGYFEDEGLYVEREAQANWKVLLDRVIDGQLDGAHMLAGQPLGATIGFGTQADVITAFSMDLNGNGITVANHIWEQMKPHVPHGEDGKPIHPIKADYLEPVVEAYRAEGKLEPKDFPDFAAETGFRPPQSEFIDGITFDGRKPNAYLEQFPIGLKGEQVL